MARPKRVNKETHRREYFEVPKGTKLNNPQPEKHWRDRHGSLGANKNVYIERRTGPEDRREPGSDRRKVILGTEVPDVKNKPAFRVTKKEHESMEKPGPKKHRAEGDNVILKERRRRERRQ